MTGQPYAISAQLELPESPVNVAHGMFMNCMQLRTAKGQVVDQSCRAALMQYRQEVTFQSDV